MRSVIVQPGQTLFDMAIQHLGSAEGVFELAQVNDLTVTASLTAGQSLNLPAVINKRVKRIFESYVPASEADQGAETIDFRPVRLSIQQKSGLIEVSPSQTLFDIAIQYLGSAEGVFELARVNDMTITTALTAGQLLIAPSAISATVVAFYLDGQYFPASETPGLLEGIDYWRIEYEFEVQ